MITNYGGEGKYRKLDSTQNKQVLLEQRPWYCVLDSDDERNTHAAPRMYSLEEADKEIAKSEEASENGE